MLFSSKTTCRCCLLWDSAVMRADLICLCLPMTHGGSSQQAPPACVAVSPSGSGRQGRQGSRIPSNWCPRRRRRRKAQSKSGWSVVSCTHARGAAVGCCSYENPFVNYDAQVGALKLERSRVPLLAYWCYKDYNAEARISVSAGVQISRLFQLLMKRQLDRLKSTSDAFFFLDFGGKATCEL